MFGAASADASVGSQPRPRCQNGSAGDARNVRLVLISQACRYGATKQNLGSCPKAVIGFGGKAATTES
jgi:hypothetical protein